MEFELISSFGSLALTNPIIRALIIGIVRSIAGWIENVLEDGKITMLEWKQLGSTIFRLLPQVLGFEAIVPGGGIAALFTDYGFTKLSNAIKATK